MYGILAAKVVPVANVVDLGAVPYYMNVHMYLLKVENVQLTVPLSPHKHPPLLALQLWVLPIPLGTTVFLPTLLLLDRPGQWLRDSAVDQLFGIF